MTVDPAVKEKMGEIKNKKFRRRMQNELARLAQKGIANTREYSPDQENERKKATPTMGGLLILIGMTISTLMWMDFGNGFVWASLLVTLGFGATGFMDDYDKVTKQSHDGFAGKFRLLFEFLIAGAAAAIGAVALGVSWWLEQRVKQGSDVAFVLPPDSQGAGADDELRVHRDLRAVLQRALDRP